MTRRRYDETRAGYDDCGFGPLGLSAGGGFGFEFWAGEVRTGLDWCFWSAFRFVGAEQGEWWGGLGRALLPAIDSNRAYERTFALLLLPYASFAACCGRFYYTFLLISMLLS
jgi:hypothetical protein